LETELIQEYKSIHFPKDILKMFTDIVQEDQWMFSVFVYIAKRSQDDGKNFIGITVNEISNNVKLERPVKVINGKHTNFKMQTANIHRQAAGKIVDKLLAMSLLAYKPLIPYKYFYITKRGMQILQEIIDRNNNLGDE
jgi:hypothetical protein